METTHDASSLETSETVKGFVDLFRENANSNFGNCFYASKKIPGTLINKQRKIDLAEELKKEVIGPAEEFYKNSELIFKKDIEKTVYELANLILFNGPRDKNNYLTISGDKETRIFECYMGEFMNYYRKNTYLGIQDKDSFWTKSLKSNLPKDFMCIDNEKYAIHKEGNIYVIDEGKNSTA